MIKRLIYRYFSNQIDFLKEIKQYIGSILNVNRSLILFFKKRHAYKNAQHFSSEGETHQSIRKRLFAESYSDLSNSNLLYFGKPYSNHRFIFIDNIHSREILYQTITNLLQKGFVLKYMTKNNIFFLFNKPHHNLKKILKEFNTLHIYKIYTNHHGIIEFGSDIAIEVERWFQREKEGHYTTHAKNDIQNKLTAENLADTRVVSIYDFPINQLAGFYEYFQSKEKNMVHKIDLVYTWVNDKDQMWQKRKEHFLRNYHDDLHISAASKNRYLDKNELKYSVRSVNKYLTGYRKIFIVVDEQKPDWLKEDGTIVLVDHKEIFQDKKALPTFNSHAIESNLHHIKDLSEHYLYLNDDIIFGRAIDVSFFFPHKGSVHIFPSKTTYIPFGKSDKKLLPVDSAAINARELLCQEGFGYAIHKYKHTPLPQIKSILVKLNSLFEKEINATSKHRFRHPKDISLTSSLFFNYAYFTGKAIQRNIQYSYFDLSNHNDINRLKSILFSEPAERPDAFCVNDVLGEYKHDQTVKYFNDIMEKFLSEKSIFEI